MDIVLNCNYVNRILVNHDYYNNGMNKYINLYVAVFLVQISLLLLNLANHKLCSQWLYRYSASISFMCRSNCFTYTAHNRATINAINRSNIRALN